MFIRLSKTADDQYIGLNLISSVYADEGLTVSIVGNKGSGKSNALAVLSEEAHRNGLPFIYYDVNGDACSLRQLDQNIRVIGDPQNPLHRIRRADYHINEAIKNPRKFIKMMLADGKSLVVDMSYTDAHPEPIEVFPLLMMAHFKLSLTYREPCMVIVDEAQRMAPQTGADDVQKESKRALSMVAADGRKRGMALVTATQRATYLDKSVIFGANVRLFGKITWEDDFKRIRSYLPPGFSHPVHGFNKMRKFRSGQFVFVGADDQVGVIRLIKRSTKDLGVTPSFKRKKQEADERVQLSLFEAVS